MPPIAVVGVLTSIIAGFLAWRSLPSAAKPQEQQGAARSGASQPRYHTSNSRSFSSQRTGRWSFIRRDFKHPLFAHSGYQRTEGEEEASEQVRPPSPQPPSPEPIFLRVLQFVGSVLAVFCVLLLFVRVASLDGMAPTTLPGACKSSKARSFLPSR